MSPRRIAIVTTQLLGFEPSGGVGAATAYLTIALAQAGHDVGVLYVKELVPHPLDPEWARRYEDLGVRIRRVAPPAVPVEPPYFWRMRAVEQALRVDTPEVVIAHEYGGPAYIAQRLRQLGLAFQDTLFVAYCHGTSPWVKEAIGSPISPEMVAAARVEQAAVELADVAVSPSAYLVGWMRERGWRLPEVRVIPLITQGTALAEQLSSEPVDVNGRVERLVFFGQLHPVKGIEPFIGAMNRLPAELLHGIELEFLGRPTSTWDPARVEARLSDRTTRALRSVSFETTLGRDAALARLKQPGTLAVMPSLAENSPNVVYECLEHGIPFLASARGGIGELVAPEDRARVLVQPTPEDISAGLRRLLGEEGALLPVRPAFDAADVVSAWGEVVAEETRPAPPAAARPLVDVVVHDRSQLPAQTYDEVNVIGSVDHGRAEWVVFLGEGDVPRRDFLEVLVRAQAASGADVVSCGVVHDGREHFFLGEPGGVGLLENAYGAAALIRRALLSEVGKTRPADWPLLAQLSASGARIVSVPAPLLSSERAPGTLEHDPGDALRVVEALEAALPDQARLLARLAVGLAAEKPMSPPMPTFPGRLRRRLGALVRRESGTEPSGAS